MTERELQDAVIELARLLGYRVAHFRPAQTARGWRTPVQADGKGFPDLVICGHARLIFAELKSARGRLSVEQHDWIDALFTAADLTENVHVVIWRSTDWTSGLIERTLRGQEGAAAA